MMRSVLPTFVLEQVHRVFSGKCDEGFWRGPASSVSPAYRHVSIAGSCCAWRAYECFWAALLPRCSNTLCFFWLINPSAQKGSRLYESGTKLHKAPALPIGLRMQLAAA